MTGGLILPAPAQGLILGAGVAQPAAGLWRPAAPAIITRRFGGAPPPRDAAEMGVEIHRQPLRAALDWQLEAVRLRREHPLFCPSFKEKLAEAGIERRCLVLFGQGDEPLRFAYIGEPTRRFFGDAWADAQIGKPQMSSGYDALTRALDAQYSEAILGGEPVHNRLIVHGLPGRPFIYTHTLLGWRLGERRVVVAMVDY